MEPVTAALLGGGLLAVLGWLLGSWMASARQLDPREPVEKKHFVPFIGHGLEFLRGGNRYMLKLCRESPEDIFTVFMPFAKIYVPRSPALVAEIQRKSAYMSFDAPKVRITCRLFGVDLADVILSNHDPAIRDRDHSLLTETDHLHRSFLAQGETLNDLTLQQWRASLDTLNRLEDGREVELLDFSNKAVGIGNMRALFGPNNVFDENPTLLDDFFFFDRNLFWFVVFRGLVRFVAPRAWSARERIMDALQASFESGRIEEACFVIRERYRLHRKWGVDKRSADRLEIGFIFAAMGNALPTAFWVLCTLFSDPELLALARKQLEDAGVLRIDGNRRILCAETLKTASPLLASIQREVLRLHGGNVTIRQVHADVVVGDHLFKRGALVQAFGEAIQKDPAIWGPDAGTFNPYRFLHSPNGSWNATADGAEDGAAVHPAAFRAFGGGKHLCPGRHFAQFEIVGFVAVLALGWDVTTAEGRRLEVPEPEQVRLPFGVLKPGREVRAVMKRRKGWEDVVWEME